MGLFNIFKKEQKHPQELPVEEIEIGSILSWLDNNFGRELETHRSKAKEMCNQAKEAFSEIKRSLCVLENSNFEKEDKAYAAVNMAKNTVVKKIRLAANKLPETLGNDWENLSSFCTAAQKIVQDMAALSPKQAVLLTRYFGREAEQLISAIRVADNKLRSLRSFLDSNVMLRLEADLIEQSQAYQHLETKIRSLKSKTEELLKHKSCLEQEMAQKKQRLKEFLQGSEWTSYRTAKREAENIRTRLGEIESLIALELEPARRPLKKLRHTGEQISNDLLELVLQNREHQLMSVLKKTLEAAERKKIPLKAKDVQKVWAVLESLENKIPVLKREYEQLKLQNREVNPNILNKKHRLEDAVTKSKHNLKEIESELLKIQKEQDQIRQQMTTAAKRFEDLIARHLERQVKIHPKAAQKI